MELLINEARSIFEFLENLGKWPGGWARL